MKPRLFLILVLVVMLAFSAAACGPAEEVEPTPEPTAEEMEAAPTSGKASPEEQPTATIPAEEPADEVDDPEDVDNGDVGGDDEQLPDPNALEQFNSYRLSQTITYQFSDESAPRELLMQVWFVREPRAQRVLMTGTDDSGEQVDVEAVAIDGMNYLRFGDQWVTTESEEMDMFSEIGWYTDPREYAEGEAESLGTARVNDYDGVRGYKLTGDAVAAYDDLGFLDEGEIEYWIANIDGVAVVVRTVATWTGALEGERIGTVSIESDLLDVNEPITIEPPEGVGTDALPDDIPTLEGAKDVTAIGNMVMFSVDLAPAEVAEWYAATMEANGWAVEGDAGWEDTGWAEGMMAFTKDGRQATVIISMEDEGSTVMVTVE